MKFINNLVAKFAGKWLAKKLDLKGDDKMEKTKKWYKSKTILTAVTVVLISLYEIVDVNLGPAIGFDLPEIPTFVFTLLGALGIYSRKVADKKID